MHGQRVCRMHGGKSPGAVEKAAERQAQAQAKRDLGRLWEGLGAVEAVGDPYAALAELAGSLRALLNEAGLRVDEMKHLAGGEHLTQLRAEVKLFENLLNRYQATLEAMGRLDVSGRHLVIQEQNARVNQQWADAVTLATNVALAALFKARPDLLPDDRLTYVNAFTRALGETARMPELPAPPDDTPEDPR